MAAWYHGIARFALATGLALGPAAPAWPQAAAPIPCCRPEPRETYAERIYFNRNSAAIASDAIPVLQEQADWLMRHPAMSVEIEGHADARGSRAYNRALGLRRAEAVRRFLIGAGIDPRRIKTISFGADRPVDLARTERGYRNNRTARTIAEPTPALPPEP